MRGGDVAAGLALSAEAGWNQTAEDWSMMIRLGQAFAIAAPDSRLVATALALPYPPDFGWISMVLVHGPYRRRGLAYAPPRARDCRARVDAASSPFSMRRPPGVRSTSGWASGPSKR